MSLEREKRSFGDRVDAAAVQGCEVPVPAGDRDPSGRADPERARIAAQRTEGMSGAADDSRLRQGKKAAAGTPPDAGTFLTWLLVAMEWAGSARVAFFAAGKAHDPEGGVCIGYADGRDW